MTQRKPLGWTTSVPFAYDDAGNTTSGHSIGDYAEDIYIYDAWNRLVRHDIDFSGLGRFTHAEYEYNALHWRTAKRHIALLAGVQQERVMYYSASWQLLEERIDDDYVNDPGVNRIALQVWGLRYIDDAVLRRINNLDEQEQRDYYHLTDALFSSVAMITAAGANPLVVERVRYDAYGKGTHRWPGDFNDDGQVNSTDEDMLEQAITEAAALGDMNYDVLMDLDRDGEITETDMAIFQAMLNHWQTPLSFGRLSDPAAADNVVGFAGYIYSNEVRLNLARMRYHDPETGRFRDFEYCCTAHPGQRRSMDRTAAANHAGGTAQDRPARPIAE